MPTRIQIAKTDIVTLFEENEVRSYSAGQLAKILDENRSTWRLAQSMNSDSFVEFLLTKSKLRKVILVPIVNDKPPVVRYLWDSASPFAVALSTKPDSYLSHGTAVFLHGLNDQIPKVIHVNYEQSPKPVADLAAITDEAMERAFARPSRETNDVFTYEDYRIARTNGKYTGRIEVGAITWENNERIAVTKLERTLIDIAVQPVYAGGIYQVLEAYKAARSRVSVNTLVATLKKIKYAYPYHQAIGFYMKRAGYEPSRLDMLKRIGITRRFYLMHGMVKMDHDPEWNLCFPSGF